MNKTQLIRLAHVESHHRVSTLPVVSKVERDAQVATALSGCPPDALWLQDGLALHQRAAILAAFRADH